MAAPHTPALSPAGRGGTAERWVRALFPGLTPGLNSFAPLGALRQLTMAVTPGEMKDDGRGGAADHKTGDSRNGISIAQSQFAPSAIPNTGILRGVYPEPHSTSLGPVRNWKANGLRMTRATLGLTGRTPGNSRFKISDCRRRVGDKTPSLLWARLKARPPGKSGGGSDGEAPALGAAVVGHEDVVLGFNAFFAQHLADGLAHFRGFAFDERQNGRAGSAEAGAHQAWKFQ